MNTKNKGKIIARNTAWMDKFYDNGKSVRSYMMFCLIYMVGMISLLLFVVNTANAIVEKKSKWNTNGTEFVLGGYDVTSYWTWEKPVMGLEEFAVIHEDGKFLFRNEQARQWFLNEPMKYLPQYGGYCATAVAAGYTAPVDADSAWHIDPLRRKIYLNYSDSVHRTWLKNKETRIASADMKWPEISEGLGWGISADVQNLIKPLTELSIIDSLREKFEGWFFSEDE